MIIGGCFIKINGKWVLVKDPFKKEPSPRDKLLLEVERKR